MVIYCFDNRCLFSFYYLCRVPSLLRKISESLKFETFHIGVKCYVTSLSKNRITKLDKWSKLEEALRFLHSKKLDNKTMVLVEQFSAMSTTPVGKKLYNHDIIIRAFEYFSTSRCLYSKLRNDYALPSIQTLTRITSKVAKVDEAPFIKNVFQNLDEKQQLRVILHEVSVKKTILFHGGTIFGKAVNNPAKLANTLLGIMIVCLYGGPTFLSKMLPVTNLNSQFIHEQISLTREAIQSSNGKVKVIICDDNRTNQKFFKTYNTLPNKPWLTNDDMFLLFDFVHLLKSIRNNWLTEKMGLLEYEDNGISKIANWSTNIYI